MASPWDLSWLVPDVTRLQEGAVIFASKAPWPESRMIPGVLDLATADVVLYAASWLYPTDHCFTRNEIAVNPRLAPFLDGTGCAWALVRLRMMDPSGRGGYVARLRVLTDLYQYLHYYANLFDALASYESPP